MANIKPFAAIRPAAGLEDKIAALPYDVYNRPEAKTEVMKNPLSFLKIDRAETCLDDSVDTYSDLVYQKARELFEDMIKLGYFIPDTKPCYYIYELTMNGRSQTGMVACASIDDYEDGIIMKHENTREEKEIDRIKHVDALDAQTGPIFLAYAAEEELNQLMTETKKKTAMFDFTASDGVRHRGWCIDHDATVIQIKTIFEKIKKIYIADGHHRCASAVKVGLNRRAARGTSNGHKESDYFLSVLFSDEQLMIMDYNRVVKDLNGLSEEVFLEKLNQYFMIDKKTQEDEIKPAKKGEISLYLKKEWYQLRIRDQYKDHDPVNGLDVSILQRYVMSDILSIEDPRTDLRIDFVGGIRGMVELEKRASTDCVAAFAMFPPSIKELFAVSDAGMLMPPKSTWFEPKLRSGLFIHSIK